RDELRWGVGCGSNAGARRWAELLPERTMNQQKWTRQRLVNDCEELSRRRRLLDRCEIAAAHDRQADRLEIAGGDARVGWHHALVAALTRPHDPPTLVALAERYLRARADIRDAGHSAQPIERISQSHPSP